MDLYTQRNHYRRLYRTSKGCQDEREQDENPSEDNSALQHGDSRMHSTVTKKHHLDRVKTSEVTMAMCPFVCVCMFSLCV